VRLIWIRVFRWQRCGSWRVGIAIRLVPRRKFGIPGAIPLPGNKGNKMMLFATIATELSTPVTDISAYWGTIQTVILTVGVFMIGYGYFKRIRRA